MNNYDSAWAFRQAVLTVLGVGALIAAGLGGAAWFLGIIIETFR